jgi:uncharacterized protein (DUF924 family)
MADSDHIADILEFWFAPGMAEKWFVKDPGLDREVGERLGALHEKAAAGGFDDWRDSPAGCLALLVLLDQVPRNIFRNDPRTYATDEMARAVTQHALDQGYDAELTHNQRGMLYLPLLHSESLEDKERAVELTRALTENPDFHIWAVHHRDIVARFGRFPHRNEILGRENTPEEAAFLAERD